MAMSTNVERFTRRKDVKPKLICPKEERNASLKKISQILQKSKEERTTDEEETLVQCSEVVEEIQMRWKKRDMVKQRLEEIEEPFESMEEKCKLLARAIAQSHHLVVYTGAGISTAARIPDYRGKDGIWTRLQQGRDIGNHDLTLAEPTFTHMALSTLHKHQILKYVVSQNCDGLHLRSGLPKQALSEVHGNMYVEVCRNCKPAREYLRLFDVTENTARYFHKTMRKCYVCNHALVDTIVHFGEKGSLHWPLNWSGACSNARKADTILCLGSSLKVLKKYPWLWQMDKPVKRRPRLYIVNLQWTPKDDVATVKIHGKCDTVMEIVMKCLGIEVEKYDRENDPIFVHATNLNELELHTTTQPLLKLNPNEDFEDVEEKPQNLVKREEIDAMEEEKPQNLVKKEEIDAMEEEKPQNLVKREEIDAMEEVKPQNLVKRKEIDAMEEEKPQNLVKRKEIDAMEEEKTIPVVIKKEKEEAIDKMEEEETTTAPVAKEEESYEEEEEEEEIGEETNSLVISENCDTIPDPDEDAVEEEEQISIPNSIFSIDSILGSDTSVTSFSASAAEQSWQTLLAFYQYQMTTSLLHSQMLGMYPYPYQTSFLYPGLHSIITPDLFKPNIAEVVSAVEEEEEIPSCDYCNRRFQSVKCMYYAPVECTFQKQELRFSKSQNVEKVLACVCCDYTTDEDDDDESDAAAKTMKIDDDTQNSNNDAEKVKVVNAGWYGKGFRKGRKLKKKCVSK